MADPRRPPPARSRRRAATGAVLVAAVALAACGSAPAPKAGGPAPTTAGAPSTAAGRTTQGAGPGIAGLGSVKAGDCVSWDQAAVGEVTARVVRCTGPHLAEVTAVTSLGGDGGAWPGSPVIAADAAGACSRPTTAYLGHPLDPLGGFAASAVRPTEADWAAGGRTLVCDLVARPPAGTALLTAVTGRVAQAPVRPVFATGTCLAEQATTASAVSCSITHEVEVSGDATVAAGAAFPTSPGGWQAVVGAACAASAQAWIGGPLTPGVASGWLPLPVASWRAGRRLVPCLVGRQMDDGEYEPTMGSLHGAASA